MRTRGNPEASDREEGYPCGHENRTHGCGGCDPGAIEFVFEDLEPTGALLRRYDLRKDMKR